MNDYFFAASIDYNIYEIDLHGTSSVSEAIEQLDSELYSIMNSKKYCRVIYGIGKGILRREILNYLKKVNYISGFKEDAEHAGSCIVVF